MRNVMWGAGLVALVLGGAGEAAALVGGAPAQVCGIDATFSSITAMTIGRTFNQNAGGFVITTSEDNYSPGGAALSLTLEHPNNTLFKGIVVVAVSSGTATRVGTFENQGAGFEINACTGGGNYVTHSNAATSVTTTFDWAPPADSAGDVAFLAYVYTFDNNFYRLVEDDSSAPVVTQNEVDGGPVVDGGDPIDGGDPVDGGAPEDDAGVEPGDDAGVEDDAGPAPPQDAGGDPPQDAGGNEPEDDAGTAEPEDAGPVDPPVGCACEASSAPANGFALAFALIGLRLIGRRRRRK